MTPESKWKVVFLQDLCVNEFWQVSIWYQVKSSEEALILCKTSIGSLKLEINDLPATKVLNCLQTAVFAVIVASVVKLILGKDVIPALVQANIPLL